MYALNPKYARESERRQGIYISELGKFKGIIRSAEDVLSQNTKSKGVRIYFKSHEGQICNFDLWLKKENGEEIPMGLRQLNAIMTCLKIKTINASQGVVYRWDTVAKEEVAYPARVFQEMANKEIGMLFETEDYQRKDTGELAQKTVFAGCFEASSELTPSEILDKQTVPKKLQEMVALLKHRPLKKKKESSAPADNGFSVPDYFNDDDIPL